MKFLGSAVTFLALGGPAARGFVAPRHVLAPGTIARRDGAAAAAGVGALFEKAQDAAEISSTEPEAATTTTEISDVPEAAEVSESESSNEANEEKEDEDSDATPEEALSEEEDIEMSGLPMSSAKAQEESQRLVTHLQKKLRYWKKEQAAREAEYKKYLYQQALDPKRKPIYRREGKIDHYSPRPVFDQETERIQTEVWSIKEQIKLTQAKLHEERRVEQVREEAAWRLTHHDEEITLLEKKAEEEQERILQESAQKIADLDEKFKQAKEEQQRTAKEQEALKEQAKEEQDKARQEQEALRLQAQEEQEKAKKEQERIQKQNTSILQQLERKAKQQQEDLIQKAKEEQARKLMELQEQARAEQEALLEKARKEKEQKLRELQEQAQAEQEALEQKAREEQERIRLEAEAKLQSMQEQSNAKLTEKEQQIAMVEDHIHRISLLLEENRDALADKNICLDSLEKEMKEQEAILYSLNRERASIRAMVKQSWRVLKRRFKKHVLKKEEQESSSADTSISTSEVGDTDNDVIAKLEETIIESEAITAGSGINGDHSPRELNDVNAITSSFE